MRATIDYGIDLGTTNSAIARQSGVRTEIIDGPGGVLVPSVVYVGPDNSAIVGRAALEQRIADPANAASEFKRLMGTGETILFRSTNRRMTPVELSAEILKDLRRRAQQRNGEDGIEAAVITVPAMFQLPQCEATREAAQLAGLRYAPLLQEPIAAAIASVGSAELREGYWLVYDFGGGTFDVSLVRSRSGRLQVLDHDGDNHLGGKDFDRLIVRFAADKVRTEGKIPNFNRSVAALEPAFERLKAEAERVRIALSHSESQTFHVERLAQANDGSWVVVDFEFTRTELEALIRPIIGRTVSLCRKMLERNHLVPSEVKRLVLVGGPTLTPCLPKVLEGDMGIEARHYVDPSEAVAIGAAIYASTQRIPAELSRSTKSSSELSLDLSYESMTNDVRPVVAGQIKGPVEPGDWQVEILSAAAGSAGGRTSVRPDGAFAARVQLAANSVNAFEVIVYRNGVAIPGLAGTFSIIHGTTIAKPVLSQSVGVVLADNSVRWYLRKGVVLPARHKGSHATTVGLPRGQSGTAIHVPLIQGESDFGDRNIIIGLIEIRADNIQRDLPVGSEVVVTLSVDEHSTTTAEAYVPLLDQTFKQIVKFGLETRSTNDIRKDVEGQRSRLAELEKIANELDESEEGGIDTRVKAIEDLLEEGGADERNQADQLLKNLTGIIDTWKVRDQEDHLSQQFAASDQQIRALMKNDDKERQKQYAALRDEFTAAVARADLQLAEAKFKTVKELEWALIREQPGFWKQMFEYLSGEVLKGPNAAEARIPIDQGKAAINKNDLRALVQACMALIRLLPQREQAELPMIIRSQVA